jgi:hypothetical protein
MATEQEVKQLKAKIAIATTLQEPQLKIWKRMVTYFKGNYFRAASNSERVSVNMVYGLVNTIVPQLYHRNPRVSISSHRNSVINAVAEKYSHESEINQRPYSPQISAQIIEQVLEYWFRVTKLKRTIRKCIQDALLQSFGVVKVGYVSNPEDGFKLSIKRVSPRDILFPVGANDFDSLKMVIHKYLEDPEVLKKDSSLENTKELKGQTLIDVPEHGKKLEDDARDKELKRVQVYEIWDKDKKTVTTICEEHDKVLKEEKWKIECHPFAFLAFNDIPEEIFPMSDMAIVEPQVMEINTYRTRQLQHNKRFNRKYVVNVANLQDRENDLRKIEHGEDGTLITVDGSAADTILPLQDAPLSGDQYAGEKASRMDLLNISGVGDDQMGAGGSAGRRQTATESSIIDYNVKSKTAFRLDLVEDFVEDIARIIIQYLQKKFTKQEMAIITGDEEVEWQLEWKKEDIQGEFDIIVEAGTSTQQSEKEKLNELLQIFNLVVPASQQMNLDPLPLLEKILKRSKVLSSKELELVLRGQSADKEVYIRHAEQENEYMAKGYDEPVLEDDDHKLHLSVHVPFLEMAREKGLPEEEVGIITQHIRQHMQMDAQRAFHQQSQPGGGNGSRMLNPGLNAQQPSISQQQNPNLAANITGGMNAGPGGV